jgi:hypothetical protein
MKEDFKYIYYACDGEDLFPIAASNTFSGLLEIVDDFMGATDKYNHSGKRLRYEPYSSKYGSDFDGTIYYKTPDEQKVKVYTVEFNYKKKIENI